MLHKPVCIDRKRIKQTLKTCRRNKMGTKKERETKTEEKRSIDLCSPSFLKLGCIPKLQFHKTLLNFYDFYNIKLLFGLSKHIYQQLKILGNSVDPSGSKHQPKPTAHKYLLLFDFIVSSHFHLT